MKNFNNFVNGVDFNDIPLRGQTFIYANKWGTKMRRVEKLFSKEGCFVFVP